MLREWRIGEELRRVFASRTRLEIGGRPHRQMIRAPGFFVEKLSAAQSQRAIKIVIDGVLGLEPVKIDPNAREHLLRGFVISLRSLDVQCSAVDGEQPSVVAKFIALSVA